MATCVLDTSVVVDLHNAQLLETSQRLSYKLQLPDVIAEELLEPSAAQLLELGFTTISLGSVNAVTTLRAKYPKPSTNDLFAFACAQAEKCILITGDAELRKAATAEGIEVHGILWFLDELVKEKIISRGDAANALERIMSGGSWLPRSECAARLKKWRSGG